MDQPEGPKGASVLWMLNRPEVDWGKFMPDLSNQRRSENVEDLRGQSWTPQEYAYRYLGIESSPKDVFQSVMHGLSHPLTREVPPQVPLADPTTYGQMGKDLGVGGDVDRLVKALRGQ